MTAYSTWRVLIHSSAGGPNSGSGAYANIAELIFAATAGGPTLATGGVAKASSEYDSGAVAANAFDGNPATFWNSNSALPPDQWLQYTLPSPVSLAEVRIQSRNDSFGTSQVPGVWDLQGSNDGVTFTTVQSYVSPTWTPGQTRTFAVAAPSAPGPGAVIVQTAVGFNVNGTVAMPAAPVDGNLLVALCAHYPNGFGAGAGWTEIWHTNGANDGLSVLTRTASGDTFLLTPSNNQGPNTVIIYEISGAGDGSIGRSTIKEVHDGSGSSVTTTPSNAIAAGSLTFGAAFKAASPVELPTLSGPSNIVIDNSVASASTSRSVQGFHFTEAGSGGIAQAVTATYATSANLAMCLIVFPLGVAAGSLTNTPVSGRIQMMLL